MTDAEFWGLIERTVVDEADPERQLQSLAAALDGLSPDEIEAFDGAFQRQLNRAYTWDLWGAAYLVHGGASDDGFEYFRSWLISKGAVVFEFVLAKPDDLADVLDPNPEGILEFEEIAYVAREAWTRKTGKTPDEFMPTGVEPRGLDPDGTSFEDDEAFLSAKYPKLWRLFGAAPLM